MQVTTEAQLLALLDVRYGAHLLKQFSQPATISAVAKRIGVPANRLYYHVHKLWRLGFLKVVKEERRQRSFQVVTSLFEIEPRLVAVLGQETVRPLLMAIVEGYLSSLAPHQASPLTLDLSGTQAKFSEGFGFPRLQLVTRRISAVQFEEWYQSLLGLTERAETEDSAAPLHTLVLVGFAGSVLPLGEQK